MFGMGRPTYEAEQKPRSPSGRALNMFGMGRPMGVRFICLAWAALCLQSPYGRVLNMFVMCRPLAAVSVWACAYYVWHVPPYACDLPMFGMGCPTYEAEQKPRSPSGRALNMFGMGRPVGMRLICLAWAALRRWSPYGRALNMFGRGRPMPAISLWACA